MNNILFLVFGLSDNLLVYKLNAMQKTSILRGNTVKKGVISVITLSWPDMAFVIDKIQSSVETEKVTPTSKIPQKARFIMITILGMILFLYDEVHLSKKKRDMNKYK
jgi:hypothetical protein